MNEIVQVVDAEIIGVEWNVTQQMVNLIGNHICGIILQYPQGIRKIDIDGDAISDYFDIPNGLTKAVLLSIRGNPPNRLLSGKITITDK